MSIIRNLRKAEYRWLYPDSPERTLWFPNHLTDPDRSVFGITQKDMAFVDSENNMFAADIPNYVNVMAKLICHGGDYGFYELQSLFIGLYESATPYQRKEMGKMLMNHNDIKNSDLAAVAEAVVMCLNALPKLQQYQQQQDDEMNGADGRRLFVLQLVDKTTGKVLGDVYYRNTKSFQRDCSQAF